MDDNIVKFAKKNKFNFYRGSENNVMLRVLQAAKKYKADIIVEITGDCPLIDPEIIDQVINTFLNNNADYVSNCNIRGYPDGMDVEVFQTKTLNKSYKMTKNPKHLEHVSLHMQENPNIFKIINLVPPERLYYPNLGLTLDELDDFLLIKKIFSNLYKKNKFFNCDSIIQFLNKNKKIKNINSKIKRKN